MVHFSNRFNFRSVRTIFTEQSIAYKTFASHSLIKTLRDYWICPRELKCLLEQEHFYQNNAHMAVYILSPPGCILKQEA